LLRLRRLNQGLNTRHWTVYKRREESNGVCLVLSIDAASVSVLDRLRWRPFSSVGQATFSLLGTKVRGEEIKEEEEEEKAERIMLSTISFIQANLQHSIAASGVFTRTMDVKGIDMALVQEL